MDRTPGAATRRTSSLLERTVAAAAGFGACAWLVWTASALAAFALRYPAFDQYRLYQTYLGLPFPANAIQIENGHRPILPALVRLAEIRWFGADQRLQLAVGFSLATACLAALVTIVLKDRELRSAQKTAAILASAIALFWLGNARILMHGNELVHAYAVALASVLIPVLVDASRNPGRLRPLIAAIACAVGATFCFGPGVACFGELMVALVLVRARPSHIVAALVAAAGAATIYELLPGRIGTFGGLSNPAQALLHLTQLLASPWMNAWLATGTEALNPSFADGLAASGLGRALLHSARVVALPFGDAWLARESAIVGTFGVLAWLFAIEHARRNGATLGRTRFVAAALATFGLATCVLMTLARDSMFAVAPGQVFADRYLPWSCLFWLGLALYAGCAPASRARSGIGFALAALTSAVLLMPAHRAFAGWMASVHRGVQASAAAAELGVFDPYVFPDNADASRADVLSSLALLRTRRLAMFAEPDYEALRAAWSIESSPALEGANATETRIIGADSYGTTFAFSGSLPRAKALADAMLLVVDEHRTVRGLAKFSGYRPQTRLRIGWRREDTFDGYVSKARPGERFSLVLVDAVTNAALAELPIARTDAD